MARITDDQRSPQEGWRDLGRFHVQGDFVVRVSKEGAGLLRLDGARVSVAEAPTVVDDVDPGYWELEGGWGPGEGGQGGQHRRSVGGLARWQVQRPAGDYEVAVFLPADDGASAVAGYRLTAGPREVADLRLDQRRGAGDWVALGRYALNGGLYTLTLTGDDDRPVLADAARFVPTEVPAPPGEKAVDDGSPLYFEDGLWGDAPEGVDGAGRLALDGPASATWQFGGVSPGAYYVVVSYPDAEANAPAAQYLVVSDGEAVDTFQVDQRVPTPGGWRTIGEAFVHGPVVTVTVSRGPAAGTLHADSLKLVSFDCEACERGDLGE